MSKESKKIESEKIYKGKIEIPIELIANQFCMRISMATVTVNGKEWHINSSGSCIIIDVPKEEKPKEVEHFAYYKLNLQDVMRSILVLHEKIKKG